MVKARTKRSNSLSKSFRARKKAMLQAKLGQDGYAARLMNLEGTLAKYNGRMTHPKVAEERYQPSSSDAKMEQFVVTIMPLIENEEEVQLVLPAKNLEVVEDVLDTRELQKETSGKAGQGVIIAAGFQATLSNFASLLRAAIKQHGLEAVFDKFDTDHSGSVDKAEFRTQCPKLDIHLSEKEVDLVWRAVDTDGSGDASPEELVAFANSFGHQSDNFAQNLKLQKAHIAAISKSVRKQNVVQKTILPKALAKRCMEVKEALSEVAELDGLSRGEFLDLMDRDGNKHVDKAEFYETINEYTAVFLERSSLATGIEMAVIWHLLTAGSNGSVNGESFYRIMDHWTERSLTEPVRAFLQKADFDIGPALLNELIGEAADEHELAKLHARKLSQANLAQSLKRLAGPKRGVRVHNQAVHTVAEHADSVEQPEWMRQAAERIAKQKGSSATINKGHQLQPPPSPESENRRLSFERTTKKSKQKAESLNKKRRDRKSKEKKEKERLQAEAAKKIADIAAQKKLDDAKRMAVEEKRQHKKKKQDELLAQQEAKRQTQEEVKMKAQQIYDLNKKLEEQQKMMAQMQSRMEEELAQRQRELLKKEVLLVEMRTQINNSVSPRQKGPKQPNPIISRKGASSSDLTTPEVSNSSAAPVIFPGLTRKKPVIDRVKKGVPTTTRNRTKINEMRESSKLPQIQLDNRLAKKKARPKLLEAAVINKSMLPNIRNAHKLNATSQRNRKQRAGKKSKKRSTKPTKYKNSAALRSATKSNFEYLMMTDQIDSR